MHPVLLRSMLWCLVSLALAAMLASCAPIVRQSDNSDWSFARQVIPILYGRKARGFEELKVIVDMTRRVGREATLRGMMDRPEFVDHWAELLINHMKVSKETPGLLGDQQSQRACFPVAVTSAGTSAELARWIRDNAPDAGPARCGSSGCGSFTMTDVVRSSLLLDDLSPTYRAYLFAMQDKPIDGNQTPESNKRSSIFKRFETVYLHRRNECLTCHNAFASTTGPSSHWNRMHPLPMYMEQAVYGIHSGRTNEAELHAPFRVQGVNGGSVRPWGLQSCGSFSRPAVADSSASGGTDSNAFLTRDLGKRSSIFDVEQLLRQGISSLRDGMARCASSPGGTGATCTSCTAGTEPSLSPAQQLAQDNVRALFDGSGCFGCHAGGLGGLQMTAADFATALVRVPSSGDASKARVRPGCANGTEPGCGGQGSHLMERLISTDAARQMPRAGQPRFTSAQLATVRDWINGLPANAGCGGAVCTASSASCSNSVLGGPHVHGDEALAMMTASSIVNMVWTEVMGYPLTIDLYHPRNEAQRNILWNLTEFNFVNKNWSLKEVLVRILMYDYFNRRAPSTGDGVVTASGATSSYELPLMFNPWAEGDPRRPPIAQPGWTPATPTVAPVPNPAYDRNAVPNRPSHFDPMSEAVHRHSARALLNSAATALDWTRPQRFYQNSYPDKTLGLAMGDYWRDTEPGFRGTSFTSLLNWESVHGTCARPSGVSTDWITRLVAGVTAFDAANPGAEAKVEDVARTIKDWIINDSSLSGGAPSGLTVTEEQVVGAVFGTAINASAATVTDLETKARRYCGMLLQTPQFMLAGLEPPPGTAPRPRLRVCNAGACSYQEICNEFRDAVSRHAGSRFRCGNDNLLDIPPISGIVVDVIPVLDLICPRGLCEIVELPSLCRPGGPRCPLPPICDPRIDGCGGPKPPIEMAHQIRQGRILTLPADSGVARRVAGTRGAQHIRGDQRMPADAAPLPGDWIVLAPGTVLSSGFKPVVVPKHDGHQQSVMEGIVILLREASQMSFANERLPQYAFPREEVEQRLRDPALQFGSGGKPLGAEPRPFDPKELDERMQRRKSPEAR